MLVDIYTWFTEGFDTADLKDAEALLAELSGGSTGRSKDVGSPQSMRRNAWQTNSEPKTTELSVVS